MKHFNPSMSRSGENMDMLEFYSTREAVIVSVNMTTGAEIEILRETSDRFMDNSYDINENGEFLFYSYRDGALYRFNVRTGQRTLLTNELSGFLFIYGDRDGKLLLSRDYAIERGEEYDQLVANGLYFYGMTTGEAGEITHKTRTNIGEPVPAEVLFEEDGYYFFEAERVLVEESGWGSTWYNNERTKLGKIPAADYWTGNTSNITELDWYDQNEWWEFLSEKQNWMW
jgi:hypothetical protein